MSDNTDENKVVVLPAILEEALAAVNKLAKLKHSYEKGDANFCEWRKRKHAKEVDEK